MLARLRVLVPFEFSVPQTSHLTAQEFDVDPYRVRIYPPCLAATNSFGMSPSTRSMSEIAHSIIPAAVQAPGAIVVDGGAAVQANLLQIDFIKSNFDRRRVTIAESSSAKWDLGDPSITFAFALMNNWINRYRYLVRSSNIRPLRPQRTLWVLEYLTDSEARLPQDPELFRLRSGFSQRVHIDLLDSEVWERVNAIPTTSDATAWEVLLLDAPALLPEVGPSVVLAYGALEAFIDWCLDKLAPLTQVPPVLWQWVNTRDAFWMRPRTDEQFSILLESLTGKSLKTETGLWELFKNLRSARHSYVHTGRAEIGNKTVTVECATELVNGAGQIISWAEGLLPKELRRPEVTTHHTYTVMTPVALGPSAADSPPAPTAPSAVAPDN